MVRPSAVASRRWASRRSLLHHDHPGRTPTSSASLARSAASVSITSSSSMSATCEACCRRTFNTTTRREPTSRSTRIVQTAARYTHPRPARSSRSQRSVASIIVTNGLPLDLSSRPQEQANFRGATCPRHNCAAPMCGRHSPSLMVGSRPYPRLHSPDEELPVAIVGRPHRFQSRTAS